MQGHHFGDMLLKEVAVRLKNCLRDKDIISRQGGDEFTVLASMPDGDVRAADVCHRIIETLAEPFTIDEQVIYVTASIGVALAPDDGVTVQELMQSADKALYAAKEAGRNTFRYFDTRLLDRSLRRARLAADLRSAIDTPAITLAYQPIVDMATGEIYKAEALTRWRHPEFGAVSQVEFIPVAESSGLIHALGNQVFHEAMVMLDYWRRTYRPDFQLSVNKSPAQFKPNPRYPTSWQDYMVEYGLPGNSLLVEITEGLHLSPMRTHTLFSTNTAMRAFKSHLTILEQATPAYPTFSASTSTSSRLTEAL